MAGIGFELKKMFRKDGLLAIIKAYGYAVTVCTGPMLLGILLLLGIRFIAILGGASEAQTELLNSMVTYTIMTSMILTNVFSLVTTRYTADQLFMDNGDKIMPSFWGSVSIMLVIGCTLYGIFLCFCGVPVLYRIISFLLFGELIIVWTQINYLTAIKDYRGIFVTFALAIVCSWIVGIIFIKLHFDIIAAMLITVCLAYGIMAVRYDYMLVAYFPRGNESSLAFLEWFSRYPQLCFIGIFLSAGLFGHFLIMWGSVIGVQIRGLFFAAPEYDIPGLVAFLSILITTINFVTSVEVNFYPKYRNYFSLFNDGGSLSDIKQAEKEMKKTLVQEFSYTFAKQFFATIVFIVVGTIVLPKLPLGMNEDMVGIYRVLCVGYAFYAIGNCIMLIQLYFADNTGAMVSTACFMAASCVITYLFRDSHIRYCGLGFLIGGFVFTLVSLFLLWRYLRKVMYHVLCSQPIVAPENKGVLKRIALKMSKRYQEKKGRLQ